MVQPKFVDVALSKIDSEVATDLRLRAALLLSPAEADGKQILECRYKDNVLGYVLETDCIGVMALSRRDGKAANPNWPVEATVRTIKRDKASQMINSLQE